MPVEPNPKARLYGTGAKTANTNVLAANVTPSEDSTELAITTATNASATPKVAVWNGSAQQIVDLNDGTAPSASAVHTYHLPVREGDEYNVQYGSDVTVSVLYVDELSKDAGGTPQ